MTQWNLETVSQLYELPFIALIAQALHAHLHYFKPDEMELCSLLSIKTGNCPEDCAYCSQSGHYQTNISKEKILPLGAVVAHAKNAKAQGAQRFCMGAAWRNPPEKDFPKVLDMITAIKDMGLETCVTLGMLTASQAQQLKTAGLDFYNHNLDTSPEYYKQITSTRTYHDRLETLQHVHAAGLKTCCGCIIGMGETRADRIGFLLQLAGLAQPPKSIPINRLIRMPGTPLENVQDIDDFEFIRTIAVTRIMMPQSMIRLSAGRSSMSEMMQTLCLIAGANSLWLGDKLLTAKNPDEDQDKKWLSQLGIKINHHD